MYVYYVCVYIIYYIIYYVMCYAVHIIYNIYIYSRCRSQIMRTVCISDGSLPYLYLKAS